MHQGFLPGVPDSHGCIRMPEKMAKLYWDNAPLGTPVTVEQTNAERNFFATFVKMARAALGRARKSPTLRAALQGFR